MIHKMNQIRQGKDVNKIINNNNEDDIELVQDRITISDNRM